MNLLGVDAGKVESPVFKDLYFGVVCKMIVMKELLEKSATTQYRFHIIGASTPSYLVLAVPLGL